MASPKEHAKFWCPVCRKMFDKAAAHNLSLAIDLKPPDGTVLDENPAKLAASLKRPLLAAMHSKCYGASIGHETEYAGKWPDPATYSRIAIDTINNVPTFFVSEALALASEGK